jgi:hypothetical protein
MQLFDLVADPWEIKDLSGDPAQAATVARLFRELRQWQERVNDTLPLDPAMFGLNA